MTGCACYIKIHVTWILVKGEITKDLLNPEGYSYSRIKLNLFSHLSCLRLEWLQQRLALSWWKSLSYRSQSIDLFCQSMDWFLDDSDLRHERVKVSILVCLSPFWGHSILLWNISSWARLWLKACNFIKDTPAQVLSHKFCKTSFDRTPPECCFCNKFVYFRCE